MGSLVQSVTKFSIPFSWATLVLLALSMKHVGLEGL